MSKAKQYSNQQHSITCNITGIATTILAPELPKLKGVSYNGLHPLASYDTCKELSRMRYSEEHIRLPNTILAGAILCILHHTGLRHDNIEATTANAILSTLPTFTLSQILSFAGTLEPWHIKRIPSLSLEEQDATALVHWYESCDSAFAASISDRLASYEEHITVRMVSRTKEKPQLIAIRKEARTLLEALKDMNALPSKLSEVCNTLLQKDYILTASETLKDKVCTALRLLQIDEADKLAKVIEDASKKATSTDKSKANAFDNEIERVSDLSAMKRKTLAEIIAAANNPKEQEEEEQEGQEAEEQWEQEDGTDDIEETEDMEEDEYEEDDTADEDTAYKGEDYDDII